jgi:hypothetical protein
MLMLVEVTPPSQLTPPGLLTERERREPRGRLAGKGWGAGLSLQLTGLCELLPQPSPRPASLLPIECWPPACCLPWRWCACVDLEGSGDAHGSFSDGGLRPLRVVQRSAASAASSGLICLRSLASAASSSASSLGSAQSTPCTSQATGVLAACVLGRLPVGAGAQGHACGPRMGSLSRMTPGAQVVIRDMEQWEATHKLWARSQDLSCGAAKEYPGAQHAKHGGEVGDSARAAGGQATNLVSYLHSTRDA